MAAGTPIPIPLAQRWRRFRYLFLPYLVVGISVVSISMLWRKQGEVANSVGEVEGVRIDVAAANDGMLLPLPQVPWTLFDVVQANQILARLDDRQIQAGLKALAAEMVEMEKEVEAAAAQIELEQSDVQFDKFREALRLSLRIEELRLELLDRNVDLASDEIELQRLSARADFLKTLHSGGHVAELEFSEARLLRDETAARLAKRKLARDEAIQQGKLAIKHVGELPEIERAAVEKILAPLRAALATQEARIEELKTQLDGLVIRAPINGVITTIHTWPGQMVRAGDPIVTLAADQGRYIVSYVRDDQPIRPKVGMTVAVRPRRNQRVQYEAIVKNIGPQVEEIPSHQLADPQILQWGLPVMITMPPDLDVRPGELIDITFRRDGYAKDG